MITLRFTIDQFEQLLTVVLADQSPDHLSNLVLMACKRPRNGTIDVPVLRDDATSLAILLDAASADNPAVDSIARLIRSQVAD